MDGKIEIKRHKVFKAWLKRLKKRDNVVHERIEKRLALIEETGYLGDHRYISDGVWELRDHYGAGYRVYFTRQNFEIIFLLCGGTKNGQERDIKSAKQLLKEKYDGYEQI